MEKMSYEDAFKNLQKGIEIPFKKETLSVIKEAIDIASLMTWIPVTDERKPDHFKLVDVTVEKHPTNNCPKLRYITNGAYSKDEDSWYINHNESSLTKVNDDIEVVVAWMPTLIPYSK